MATRDNPEIMKTGGKVDSLVQALLDSCNDSEVSVRLATRSALSDIGKKQTNLVLSSSLAYLKNRPKLSVGHRVLVLEVISDVLTHSCPQTDRQLALKLAEFTTQEMTKSKDVIPDHQGAASLVLVRLSSQFVSVVMESLLVTLTPGQLPHFFILQTLGQVATNNVLGSVAYVKVILGSLLPMLGLCKHDNIKWACAAAFSRFSAAILDYLANIDQAPDHNVTMDSFSTEIDSAYDVLYHVWLNSREPKLRGVVIEAVGQMSQLMSCEKLSNELTKLVPGLLSLYKKHNDPFTVTQAVYLVLEACRVKDLTSKLEVHMTSLMNTLQIQVCVPVDYSVASSLKNFNEALRCFTLLTFTFPAQVVTFLLEQLAQPQEKTRIGTLLIVRHVVNTSSDSLTERQSTLLSGLNIVYNDPHNKVKKVLAQVVLAMADHGYLYLEGGHLLIEFIVRQCALPDEAMRSPDSLSNSALREMCADVLRLLCTTIDGLTDALWPQLLEYLGSEQYTGACGCVARCISSLCERMKTGYQVDFDSNVDLPRPTVLLGRLLVLSQPVPTLTGVDSLDMLQCLMSLAPVIHEDIVPVLQVAVPAVCDKATEKQWSARTWEDLLIMLLCKCLDQVNDEDWTIQVGKSLIDQMTMYNNYPHYKGLVYKLLGGVMRKSSKKDFVSSTLDVIHKNVKHLNSQEQQGCTLATGLAASSHLDLVLDKLDTFLKNEGTKKQTGLLGFIKDLSGRSELEEGERATLMISYGFVCQCAPIELLCSRVDGAILRAIMPHFTGAKAFSDNWGRAGDPLLKKAMIQTAGLLAQSLDPQHCGCVYELSVRDDIIKHIQNYIRGESPTDISSDIRLQGINTITKLVRLDPALTLDQVSDLLQVILKAVMVLVNDSKKGETYEDVVARDKLIEHVVEATDELLCQLTRKNLTEDAMYSIVGVLLPWATTGSDVERSRALKLIHDVLVLYKNERQPNAADIMDSTSCVSSTLIGHLLPRVTDPDLSTRVTALQCLQTLLESQDKGLTDSLTHLEVKVKHNDPDAMFSVVSDVTKVLIRCTRTQQLAAMMMALIESLQDLHQQSSSGACVVLNGLIKQRSVDLPGNQVDQLVRCLLDRLRSLQHQQTVTGTKRCFKHLINQHLNNVTNILIQEELPLDQYVQSVWQFIGEDNDLCSRVVYYLLDKLQQTQPYEEDRDDRRTATTTPVQVVAGLIWLLDQTSCGLDLFPRTLPALVVMAAATAGCTRPHVGKDKKLLYIDPVALVVTCCQTLLCRCRFDQLSDFLRENNVWEKVQFPSDYPEGCTQLARGLCLHQPREVAAVAEHIMTYMNSPYDPERIASAAFLAELVFHVCGGDEGAVLAVKDRLLQSYADRCLEVRKFCIRGLGNMSSCGPKMVEPISTTLLAAMMSGMDDKDDLYDAVTLEAMGGLSKLIGQIEEEQLRPVLINIALRIRPCMEKELANVRQMAFTLFGDLGRISDGASRSMFVEQIQSNFVSLLLHLNDPDKDVRKACKVTLRAVVLFLGSDSLTTMCEKHLIDTGELRYGEYVHDLAKILVNDFSDKVNLYVTTCVQFFKSQWSDIRCNAALLAGELIGTMPADRYDNIAQDHVTRSLIQLLEDSNITVRCAAASAMSRMALM